MAVVAAVRNRIGHLRQRVADCFHARGGILLYHRVADTPTDPYNLRVTSNHFDQQMRVLREIAQPMPLDELAAAQRRGKIPERAVAVTFDDGYVDNLRIAKPVLEKYEIPATVFMTTGEVGRTREFWWDELESIFLQPGELPESLSIDIAGRSHSWSLAEAATWTQADCDRTQHWRLTYPGDPRTMADPSPRHRAFREVYCLIQGLADRDRQAVLDELLAWAGRTPGVREAHAALDQQGMRELIAGDLITLGAHTINHPALATQSIETQREEIAASKRTLEDYLDQPINSFAYPYGIYDAQTVNLVREVGFDYACACEDRPMRRTDDRMRLPRLELGDIDGEQFRKTLLHALG